MKTKLYILEPVKDWKPWYDKLFGVIVRARTEKQARKMASKYAGDEGKEVWLDADKTTCTLLLNEGDVEVIMTNFANA